MSNKVLKTVIAAGVIALGAAGVAQAKSPVPGKPGPLNIVDTAIDKNAELGVFNTLLTAATCDYFDGAVVALLSGSDRYTLFAPTDTAFGELGLNPANVCGAFAADPSALLNILKYHVTEGRRFSNSVFNKRSTKMVEMLNEQYIITGPGAKIQDGAGQTIGVVLANVNASNGVIHAVNKVLLPATN